jgi:YidC/Oxa1 family membrane protein insertase
MKNLYYALLHDPLVAILVFLYNTVAFQDLGLAIIFLTFLIRLVLAPLFYKGLHNQAVMQQLQPEIEKIQALHKHNREKQGQALMELYKQHKINPFSGFLIILIQLPILIALYQVFLNIPEGLNTLFFNFIDLSQKNIPIVILAAALQYVQGKLSLPKEKPDQKPTTSSKIAKNMVLFGPLLTIAILFNLPSAIAVYWLATTIFSIAQQLYINQTLYKDGTNSTNNSQNT